MSSTVRRAWYAGLGVLLAATVWTALAATRPELVLPSPLETLAALARLADGGGLWSDLGVTGLRTVAGLAAAVGTGVLWGAVTGSGRAAAALLAPMRMVLLGIPPVGLVVVVSVWLGVSGTVAVLVVAVLTAPTIAEATAAGVRAVDPAWAEMARAFQVSRWRQIRHILLPAVASPVIAAVTVAAAAAFRAVVMAELLAAPDGVGSRIALARANLDTAQVFAWCLVAVGVAVALDLGVLAPTRRRALRWSSDAPADPPATTRWAPTTRWAWPGRRQRAGRGPERAGEPD